MNAFLTSATSTIRGIKFTQNTKRNNTFKEEGIKVDTIDEKKFYQFLNSEQFKSLRQTIDSKQIMHDFIEAMSSGEKYNTILKEYEKYKTTKDMTFEQVAEQRKEKQKKLLKGNKK